MFVGDGGQGMRACNGGRGIAVPATVAVVTLFAAASPGLAVQADDLPVVIPTGRVIENVGATTDPSQTFSLYVPSDYSPDRTWPLVLLMDPRGNAGPPLEKLVPAAERLGYVIASSNNTASDVGGDPNTPAVNAMMGTLQPRLSLDDRRFYLFGMSGTARAAWALAYAGAPHIAGIAGFAAGIPPDMDLEGAQGRLGAPFVFYGGAGDGDFNHSELVLLENRLKRLGFRYSINDYPGPHGWPSEQTEFESALSFMHLMAMRRDLLEPDSAWLGREYEARLSAARALEENGDVPRAWQAYADLAADMNGLVESAEASERAAALVTAPETVEWRARRLALAREHIAYEDGATKWLDAATTSHPSLENALVDLGVDSLKAVAADESRPDESAAARRALATLFSMTSFYYPRFHIEGRDWPRARLALEIANTVWPGTSRVCGQLEHVLDELGEDRDPASLAGCR